VKVSGRWFRGFAAGRQAEGLGSYRYHEWADQTEENETYTVEGARTLCATLRARSFPPALASRNERLVAMVERERVKVRKAEALHAEVARSFTATWVKHMARGGCRVETNRSGVLFMWSFEQAPTRNGHSALAHPSINAAPDPIS